MISSNISLPTESEKEKSMPNLIELEIPNHKALGGTAFGKLIYQEQLKERLTPEVIKQGVTIKFPDSIIAIGSFFMDGLLEALKKSTGIYAIRSNIRFITSSSELTKEIYLDID